MKSRRLLEGRAWVTDKQPSALFLSRLHTRLGLLHHHPGLFMALFMYLCVALSYFFIVPIFEAPDEWTHTGHVKYIADGNGLPVMLPGQGIWGGQQPPLYYVMGAILVQPFDLTDFDNYLERAKNPHASLGYALDPGNKNNYLHTSDEDFPYHGLALTVHVLRLYSMFFGLITIVFIYLTAFEIINVRYARVASSADKLTSHLPNPKWFATSVALFVACQPMFAFITASVANEPANIAFSAIGLWLTQRYVLRGPSPRWWRPAALGLVLGLISLSKMTGLSFGLVVVVAMLHSTIATRKVRGVASLLWRDAFIIGTVFLLTGGWWYWRNYQLYGDFFQQGLYKIYFNQVPQPLSLSDFLFHLTTAEVSFWATFGWLNLIAPEWVYSLYRIISRIGLLGVVLAGLIQLVRSIKKRMSPGPWRPNQRIKNGQYQIVNPLCSSELIIHLIFPLAIAFSLARLVALEGGLQGRQLLPALGSIGIIIMWGWWVLPPVPIRLPVLGLLMTVLCGLSVWLPYTVVAREYIPAPLLTEADLPASLSRLDLTFDNKMKLIGVQIGVDEVQPGERVPVKVYWQALNPMTTNYSVFVHLIGRNHQNVGQLNTYPGLGLRPTTSLQANQIVVDTYPVLVNGGSEAPSRLRINVGLFDFYEPGRPGIQPLATDGTPTSPTVGQIKLVPVEWAPYLATSPLAQFADNIWFIDYRIDNCTAPDDACTITFEWLARGRPKTDYTIFIQLWRNSEQVAGFDAPPLQNDYPTSLWAAQEIILDPHRLDLSPVPPGKYQILVGLYNLATGERLPATRSDGRAWPDHAVSLGTISINP